MSNIVSGNNKRIAKNTLALYVRMLFLMAINLYTSRIVLSILGITDYGIYNVVGGFVALFTMVSGTMATATQRFLSFEIGKGTPENITRLFSTSIMIHLILGGIIIVIAETIGLWFLNYKMVFPLDRYYAANWVFQFSVLTLVINVLSVPYNASIIAYERMKAFAFLGILEAIAKLLIVYLIAFSPYDRLIIYAFLLMIVAISIRAIYGIYVSRNFHYCRFCWTMDKEYRQRLLSFISYNFIGSISGIAKTQGINVVLNLFFGATVNAARGIAVQVLHAVSGFVSNFQLAMNPQIVKLYAAGNKEEMYNLMCRGCKFSYLLMLMLSLPIAIEAPYILNLWLVEVPEYTVVFVQLTLAITLVDSLSQPMVTALLATGNVKRYQLINGTYLMMTVPVVYIVMEMGYGPVMAFVVSLMFSIVGHFTRLVLISLAVGFSVRNYINRVTIRIFLATILSLMIPCIFQYGKGTGFLWFLGDCVICVSSVTVFAYLAALSKEEKKYLNLKISKICNRNYSAIPQ